jgi:3-oxoacyl-[acyl-carrier-protein] synthase-3
MSNANVIGTGLYAPERVVTNDVFDDLYGEDVSTFLRERRNITERRYAAEGQTTSDLAAEAARVALRRADTGAEEIDLLIVSTDTPDQLSPSTAAVVQAKLGATGAATFDLNTACAGFPYALTTGANFLKADPAQYERVLVISAYLMSRFIDYDDKNIASLFADGAGAAVLAPSEEEERGLLASILRSEGQYHDRMGIYAGGAAHPLTPPPVGDLDAARQSRTNGAAASQKPAQKSEQKLAFRRKFPDDYNQQQWTRLVHDLSERLGVAPGDVDRYFFTQLNVETIWDVMDGLDLNRDKAHNVMDRFGYTGNACLAMALADADAQDLLADGDLVYLIASGGGAAIGGVALRWG